METEEQTENSIRQEENRIFRRYNRVRALCMSLQREYELYESHLSAAQSVLTGNSLEEYVEQMESSRQKYTLYRELMEKYEDELIPDIREVSKRSRV